MKFSLVSIALTFFVAPSMVLAHVSINPKYGSPSAVHSGVLRVPHDCSGSPIVNVTIDFPSNVSAVSVSPYPGWNSSVSLPSGTPPTQQGSWVMNAPADGVSSISFNVSFTLPAGAIGDRVYFPVTQGCLNSSITWNETVVEGVRLAYPAPYVTLGSAPVVSSSEVVNGAGLMTALIYTLAVFAL